ncbi:SWI2/SNF2-containing protein, partial [Toxoplasma gondii FOU]
MSDFAPSHPSSASSSFSSSFPSPSPASSCPSASSIFSSASYCSSSSSSGADSIAPGSFYYCSSARAKTQRESRLLSFASSASASLSSMAAQPGEDSVFTFGKHAGKSFSTVAREDSSYCAWALSTPNPSGSLLLFVDFLKRRRGEIQDKAKPSACIYGENEKKGSRLSPGPPVRAEEQAAESAFIPPYKGGLKQSAASPPLSFSSSSPPSAGSQSSSAPDSSHSSSSHASVSAPAPRSAPYSSSTPPSNRLPRRPAHRESLPECAGVRTPLDTDDWDELLGLAPTPQSASAFLAPSSPASASSSLSSSLAFPVAPALAPGSSSGGNVLRPQKPSTLLASSSHALVSSSLDLFDCFAFSPPCLGAQQSSCSSLNAQKSRQVLCSPSPSPTSLPRSSSASSSASSSSSSASSSSSSSASSASSSSSSSASSASSSSSASSASSAASRERRVTLDVSVAFQLCAPDAFRIVAQKTVSLPRGRRGPGQGGSKTTGGGWMTHLPRELWTFLKALGPLDSVEAGGRYSQALAFAAEKYDMVLKSLNECFIFTDLFPLPPFVLRSFRAFMAFATPQRLPRKTALILLHETSPSTKRRLATLASPAPAVQAVACADSGEETENGGKAKAGDTGEIEGSEQERETALIKELKPFQLEGYRFGIQRNGRVLVGDEMGLGKTLQALAIAAFYHKEWPFLVICPSSIRFQWRDQALRWLSELLVLDEICLVKSGRAEIPGRTKMVIISYDMITKQKKFMVPYQVVICDESHYLKNFQAKRTQAICPLLKNAKRAILLSGTPALNRPVELFQQFDALVSPRGERSDKPLHASLLSQTER